MQLRQRGRNLLGLCPFHGEKTPSFNVYPESGSFYCFGCGQGGDVITFIRKIENLDYIDAVAFLAKRAGLSLHESGLDDGLTPVRRRVLEANREAAKFFHSSLQGVERSALEYLMSRKLKGEVIRRFGLGYSTKSRYALVDHLRAKGFKEDELIQANLAYKGRTGRIVDRFVGRIMFPIIDVRGNVVAFGGRAMGEEKPKYLNTADTLVFKKSNNLFSMNFAREHASNGLILTEGYMDVVALHGAGFKNAVATLGTALTVEQVALISRYTSEVVLCYDSDEAGQKATARSIELLRRTSVLIKVVNLPRGKDPDEFLRTFGDEGKARFKLLIEGSKNDIEYRLQVEQKHFDISTTDGKIGFLKAAVGILSSIENPLEQEVYAGRLGELVNIDRVLILGQVARERSKARKNQDKKVVGNIRNQTYAQNYKINPEKRENLRVANAEEAIIAYVINNPQIANNMFSRIKSQDFCTTFNRRVMESLQSKAAAGESLDLTALTQDFSPEEINGIARILASTSAATATKQAVDEYIDVIIRKGHEISKEGVLIAGQDQIMAYMERLRDRKK